MEQGYWDKMRNFTDEAADYFSVVGKNEKDMMNNTKNYTTRVRLNREIQLGEDFRKRFMTREYGNYEKYEEGRNTVKQETEKGQNDFGGDRFSKNHREMLLRLKTEEGQEVRDEEKQDIEDILTNDAYGDSTIKTRLDALKESHDHMNEAEERDNEIKMARSFELADI